MVVGQSPDENNSYVLQDANGSVETIAREDIITDQDDAQRVLEVRTKCKVFVVTAVKQAAFVQLGDPVVALHPSYPHSYAPGMPN